MLRSNGSLLCLASLLFHACASAPPPDTARSVPRQRRQESSSPPDSFAVSGLRGTLTQQEIQNALEPKLPKLLRCVEQRLGAVEVLAGSITFSFHVATNGQVASVTPTASSLGDRAAERCMLQVAEAVRFPEPHGGEADFAWPLEVPLDPELRPPVELRGDLVRDALAAPLSALAARCGGGLAVVTAYVDPDGRVVSVGAAAPDIAGPVQLDCISEGVRGLAFPSPGSYLGKTSFTVP